jgi:hypothetical protein
VETKKCSKCGEVKELSEYYGNGSYSRCKECIKKQYDERFIPKPKIIKPEPKKGYKFCPYCKTEKLLSEFSSSKIYSDGLSQRCKKCNRDYQNKRYIKKEKPECGEGFKYCLKCKTIKPISEFFLTDKGIYRCRECRKIYNRDYGTKRRAKRNWRIDDKRYQ